MWPIEPEGPQAEGELPKFSYWTYVGLGVAAIFGLLGFELVHGAVAAAFQVVFLAALVMSTVWLVLDMVRNPTCARDPDTLPDEVDHRFRHWTIVWIVIAAIFGVLGFETSDSNPIIVSRGSIHLLSLDLSQVFRLSFLVALALSILSLIVDLFRYGPCSPRHGRTR